MATNKADIVHRALASMRDNLRNENSRMTQQTDCAESGRPTAEEALAKIVEIALLAQGINSPPPPPTAADHTDAAQPAKKEETDNLKIQEMPSSMTPEEELAVKLSWADVFSESGSSVQMMKHMTEAQLTKHVEIACPSVIARQIFAVLHGKAANEDEETKDNDAGPHQSKSSRSKFRQVVSNVVGQMPKDENGWQDPEKWKALVGEGASLTLGETFDQIVTTAPFFASYDAYHLKCVETGNIKMKTDVGFTEAEAACMITVQSTSIRAAMGRAVEEQSGRYAALTHGVYNALARKAAEGKVAPKCYIHLEGQGSLSASDVRWTNIRIPDEHGFCGLTTFAPLFLRPVVSDGYDPAGIKDKKSDGKYATMDSTVVCFESAAPSADSKTLSSAVDTGGNIYVLPPLTLIEVVKVQEGSFEYLPGKIINQTLITVRPTFVLPAKKDQRTDGVSSKYAGDRRFLNYGGTGDAVRGLEDITDEPPLTMEQEWARDDPFRDWQGELYSAFEEYTYVVSVIDLSKPKRRPGQEKRDEGHGGWRPENFLDVINRDIARRAAALTLEHVPQLTLKEVVAIRLYTGPGYVPLNAFLREVAKLGADWRRRTSHMHQLSYSSTVRHLTDGLRKLVRVNGEGSFGAVSRGVRGELPEAFWLKDDFGMVTATDFASMSTSVDAEVCKQFMDKTQSNVLWEVRCGPETSEGFHSGADVSLLSQFPGEQEMLFPPLTMLTVSAEHEEWSAQRGRKGSVNELNMPVLKEEAAANGARFKRIVVTPTFI